MIRYQLTRPFEYLRIRHSGKACIDWLIPLALSVATSISVTLIPLEVNFFGSDGVIRNMLGLFQALPGFFIAALAAVATFGRTDIDAAMPGDPPPLLRIRTNTGRTDMVALSRRRFLCLLFSFLTVESIVIVLMSVAYLSLAPAVKLLLGPSVTNVASLVAMTTYLFVVVQLFVATLWGLYYLGDRLHQPDA